MDPKYSGIVISGVILLIVSIIGIVIFRHYLNKAKKVSKQILDKYLEK